LGNTTDALFHGATPLIQATRANDVQEVRRLIAIDVDQTNRHGWTALMFGAKAGLAPGLDILLKAGANPNIESKRITGNTQATYPNTTALREAIGSGHVGVANALIEGGAKVDPTAFAMAGGLGDVALLKKMKTKGADPNVPSAVGQARPDAMCGNATPAMSAGVL